jgi:hypothetical protein
MAVAAALAVAGSTALAAVDADHADAPPAPGLRFEQVFQARDSATPLHYKVRYLADNGAHTVEAWEAGDRLARRTDDTIELHATRSPDGASFALTVLDLKRKISTRIDRDSLHRIGDSTEWSELAQGLRRPRTDYVLHATAAPDPAPQAVGPCDWYELIQGHRTTRVCWSPGARLPLLMVDADGRVEWQVLAVDKLMPSPETFEIRDTGFVRNDAREDITGD